jgi:2-amino-4-hydroxy-6-hydroxymethyldihydropteridine diphosphokinase
MRYAIGIGSNLGHRLGHLQTAVGRLGELGTVEAVSSLYESAPVGGPPQDRYLNAVVVIDASLAPRELLEVLLAIEKEAGRRRDERWGPRTLDLDLLVAAGAAVDEPNLQLPHPRAGERRFVLEPLAEVWPDAEVRPEAGGGTAAGLLKSVADQKVSRIATSWTGGVPSFVDRGDRWVLAQAALLAVWAYLTVRGIDLPPRPRNLVGLPVLAAGLGLAGWAWVSLGRGLSAFPAPLPTAALVARGPYALVRHPMYLGVVLTMGGFNLAFRSGRALAVVALMLPFFYFKSRAEEAKLAVAFGEYADYRRRVRHRLIPGVV